MSFYESLRLGIPEADRSRLMAAFQRCIYLRTPQDGDDIEPYVIMPSYGV